MFSSSPKLDLFGSLLPTTESRTCLCNPKLRFLKNIWLSTIKALSQLSFEPLKECLYRTAKIEYKSCGVGILARPKM
jgi:hypothetical protein